MATRLRASKRTPATPLEKVTRFTARTGKVLAGRRVLDLTEALETEWQALIEPHYVAISLVISCTLGIVFGIIPARRAAQMDPITALRYE